MSIIIIAYFVKMLPFSLYFIYKTKVDILRDLAYTILVYFISLLVYLEVFK